MILQGQVNARLVATRSLRSLTIIAMSAAGAGSAAMLAVALAGPGAALWLLVLVLVVAVTPNGAVFPNCTALVLQRHPERAGAATGVMGLATFLIGGLISPMAGAAGARSAVPMGTAMAASAAAGLAALVLSSRPAARPVAGRGQ